MSKAKEDHHQIDLPKPRFVVAINDLHTGDVTQRTGMDVRTAIILAAEACGLTVTVEHIKLPKKEPQKDLPL